MRPGIRPLEVELLVMGDVGREVLEAVGGGIEEAFGGLLALSRTTGPLAIPEGSYDALRGQFNSSSVLDFLRTSYIPEADRVLAITHVDLFVPGLNFVFGQAECPGRFAIISVCRLRPEFYGAPPDEDLFLSRCVKEAVHELGHTMGLRHCGNRRCVMAFSSSIWDTDRKEASFCRRCFSKLLRLAGY